ncbi:hypothetical protein JKP88DRAFT_157677 [Tribonema minus]|uniref:VWFA domain-containing protein n=1 Tax=Tribonema minus TaxID=303371 RepID=A0A835YYE7_9STRA|nr:hypothetical protein JKP88DRAFT_157677 [Tribonema minus]
MKLPPCAPPAMHFINAKGSSVPKEFAIAARTNPDMIPQMAETSKESKDLHREALARQYVVIVDMSGSMATRDGRGTRWDSARVAVEKMVDTIFEYDVDHTVPLYLFDSQVTFVGELTSPSQVKAVFKEFGPRGSTGLGPALREALGTYAGTKRPNYELVPGTTFIVLLDGGADDEGEVTRVLQEFADPKSGYVSNHTQLAVSFIQIGDDAGASAFLKRLDDGITPDICDFVKDDILSQSGGLDTLLYNAIFD